MLVVNVDASRRVVSLPRHGSREVLALHASSLESPVFEETTRADAEDSRRPLAIAPYSATFLELSELEDAPCRSGVT